MVAIQPNRTRERDEVEQTIEHVTRSIEHAKESREPFLHIVFDDVFPSGLYARMLDAMPEPRDYRRMSGRARTNDPGARTKLDLFPEWIGRLPREKRATWELVGEALVSAPVREAFRRRLAEGLERRFGVNHAFVGMYPVPILTRDVPGYSIGIHPDTKWKGITVQIYLPRDRSIEHVGTVFHAKKSDGTYRVATRVPFSPNSGYAFAVGDDTYHSADTVGPEVKTRDSILLTYFVDETLLEVAHNRWKRFGNWLRATARHAGMR